MIWILTRGLFLTCTESPVLLSAHNTKNKSGCVMLKEKCLYLETRSPVHGEEFPSSQVPCLKSTAFMPLTLTPAPASRQKKIHLHIDDIHMPAASVRHRHVFLNILSKNWPWICEDSLYTLSRYKSSGDMEQAPADQSLFIKLALSFLICIKINRDISSETVNEKGRVYITFILFCSR